MMDGVRKKTGGSLPKNLPPVTYATPKRNEEESVVIPRRNKDKERLAFRELPVEGNGSGKYIGILLLILLVGGAFFYVGWKTRTATVQVVSSSKTFPLTKQVTVSSKVEPGALRLETMSVPFSYNLNGQSGVVEEKDTLVEESWYATGTIRIFNTTSKTVKLRTETRFQNPDTVTFLSQKAVTIPAGTSSKPGTVDVIVRSAEPVTKVSTSLDDFILPGLSVAEQKEIFARSVSALTKDPNQDPSTALTQNEPAAEALSLINSVTFRTWMQEEFIPRMKQKVPVDFEILLGGERYLDLRMEDESTVRGLITFYLVHREEFSDLLRQEISILESIGIDYILIDSTEAARVQVGGDTSQATLSGSVQYHVAAPHEVMETMLLDSHVSSFETTMRGLSWVDRATLSIRPWWTPKLPRAEESLLIHYEVGE